MLSKLLVAVCLAWLIVPQNASAQDVYGGRRQAIDLGEFQGFVLEPAKPAAEGDRPWIWYAPVLGNNPGKPTEWMLRQLIEHGCYVVGVNVGESQGNPHGRAGYSKFYQHVVREFKLQPKARLMAQSRGGLMLYNWAVENPDRVQCVVGIYPACNLLSYPGLKNAAKAYGLSPEEMQQQLAQHNPIDRIEPLAKTAVPILHIHGDADRLVPLDKNSQVLHDRYQALGGEMEIIVIPGEGHAAIPAYFENQRLVDFLLAGGFAAASQQK